MRYLGFRAGAVVLVAAALVACTPGGAATHSAGSVATVSPLPSTAGSPKPAEVARHGLRGLGVLPVPRTPHFLLTDTAGRPFDFQLMTRGRLTYLYFGYTHCPDSCPTTMADLAVALRTMSPQVRRNVTVVFVTTDPGRDSPAQLRSWLDKFDPTFVGLTGSALQIVAAERASMVPLARPEANGKGGYGVTHSSEVFAFSPDGLSHVVYADGFQPADYAHDMPLLLERH